MAGMQSVRDIPHLQVTDVVWEDTGDEIARRHGGTPTVHTACGVDIVATLATKLRDKVRCEACKTASEDPTADEGGRPIPTAGVALRKPGHGDGPDGPPCAERDESREAENTASTRWRLCLRCGRVTTLLDGDGLAWCGGQPPAVNPPAVP